MVCSSLTVERTRDMKLVKRLWTDPRIYSQMTDDGCPKNPADWHPSDSDRHYFLIPWLEKPTQERVPMGIVAYYSTSFVIFDIHIGILPQYQHQMTQEIVIKSNAWIFARTPCEKILAFVPITKLNVLTLALKCGFKEECYLQASFLSDGTLTDQHLLSIGRSQYVRNVRGR